MGLKRIKQISLIWVAISLTALSRSQTIPAIKNLECLNDFDKKMFCFWEIAGSSSNCSEDFALTFAHQLIHNDLNRGTCLDLQNEQLDGSAVPNKCICNIPRPFFVFADVYLIEVASHGQPVGNTTIEICSTVKPIAPSNVRIEFQDEENGLVQWNIGYESNFILSKLSYHVQILFKHGRKVEKEDWLTQLELRYKFSKRQLKRGEEYVVRVRTRPTENQEFRGTWSEWSSEAEWRNDYRLTLLDMKYIIVPITCLVLICLIIVLYVCLTRFKKNWWNNIPNPAKSKLAQSELLQKPSLNPEGKSATKASCASFISRIVKAHKSRCDKLTQQQNAEDYVNICGGHFYKKVFFEPEDEDTERCVKMYLIKESENPVQEDKMEYKVEDHLMEPGDLSIARMFFDILCDSSGVKVDTFGKFNTGTSLGGSGWMDSFGKKETQRCNSNVSAYRESGYSSYGSEDSPIDFVDIDRLNTKYFDQWPDNEGDSIPYTSRGSVKKNCLYPKGDHLESSASNSFANLLYKSKDFIIDPSTTFCLDNLSNIALSKRNSLLTPKSILYYNTKNYFSQNNDHFQSIIGPKPEQVSEITLQCCKSNSNPTSICHVSEYQSFDQAVQVNDPEYGCHISGSKSFDQAVLEGGPNSGCQVSGYQSFDQAVQQGDLTSVCQVTEYQSFDQAVLEGGPNSGCQVSGYQSFDQAVQQGDLTSVCQVTEYQSFDQAVLEGGPNSGCQVSGYQSFDQAVQQGDLTSVCQVTEYQSFDQAVRQNETSGSTNYSVVETGYKPLEDLIFQNSDYSVMDMSKNEGGYQLGKSHCQNNAEYLQTKTFINVTDNNKTTTNSQKRELSIASTQYSLENFLNSTKEKYHPSKDFSDKSFEAIKLAVDTSLENDLAVTHESVPLALTFDICEHLRNLKNMHGNKVPLNNLLFPCHLDDVQSVREKLASYKKLTSQKCPSTKFDTIENLSYYFPLCDLEALGPDQQTKHLLIQQIDADKDDNSYMKISLP
ncbi:uncharacterized protein LOC120943421 isoform X2 [Rana temporaria]|uniref:uncharacterized protein LOC120943421 isoform X2 n=1 Tax=Rana temporaria TaxID=8407 RepID=UPI001AAD7AB6|nr:uncharacterized protein LOC120943421 isoform X2 [Rana temporaria]